MKWEIFERKIQCFEILSFRKWKYSSFKFACYIGDIWGMIILQFFKNFLSEQLLILFFFYYRNRKRRTSSGNESNESVPLHVCKDTGTCRVDANGICMNDTDAAKLLISFSLGSASPCAHGQKQLPIADPNYGIYLKFLSFLTFNNKHFFGNWILKSSFQSSWINV